LSFEIELQTTRGDLPRRRETMSGGSRRLRCGFFSII